MMRAPLLAVLSLSFCVSRGESYTTFNNPNTSFAWFEAGNFSVVVDVRTESEYEEGHIAGAVFIENMATFSQGPSSLSLLLRSRALSFFRLSLSSDFLSLSSDSLRRS